jgi:predicted phosphodiesterase
MRTAALYDIHGNLPALRAVLSDVSREGIERVLIGGDVAAGPLPRATVAQLMTLGPQAYFVSGNADREAIEAFDLGRCDPATEVGVAEREAAFTAASLTHSQRDFMADFAATVVLEIDGLGPTLFCHGSPRSDAEIITTVTSDDRLRAILAGTAQLTIVAGHTHRQCDRRLDGYRFINAGSVGRPYEGRPGAFWACLGPEVALRRTHYDMDEAAAALRDTGFPEVEDFLRESLLDPVDADEVAAAFEHLAIRG